MSPIRSTSPPEERPERPPSKRRRPHRKSRTGCLDCRKRRVKCSEERPSCRSCIRREVVCEYPEEAQAVDKDVSQAPEVLHEVSPSFSLPMPRLSREQTRVIPLYTPVSTPGTVSGASQTSAQFPAEFGIRDLALLHHWTMSTSVDIYKTPDVDVLWQVTIPHIGFQHPFVAHAIISLAALHMAYISGYSNSSYVTEATQHHEKALAGFHEIIQNFTSEKSEAVLAWSLLNVLYVFSISRELSSNAERDTPRLRKDRLLGVEWIPMIRGVDAVLAPHYDFIRSGRMSSIVTLGNWDELEPDKIASTPVDKELCRTRDSWKNSSDGEVYEQTLRYLRKCYMYMSQFETIDGQALEQWGCNRAWAAPMAFIHFAPQQYFTLLHQRQPPALVLFSFFGALLHTLNEIWFLEGWGKDIVEVVDELLGSFWRSWISWPLHIVGIE
ncbi:Sterol uptake control protein 2-like protein 1 [Colletotrichum truncatum]|uniref:Sterol uptake control protein 2-like protein 1 n=1 Tax=Colletotrichum truncatum TaxID=5467 RepID=A0ACC3YR26_COLTU|nr:Sterol uptake control protein 2-like protein 1 [Colletotrichum truncatum]KAF6799079.1 Sterol uptake control protein 2-like protein 1 [Colletotrichum truncatum]